MICVPLNLVIKEHVTVVLKGTNVSVQAIQRAGNAIEVSIMKYLILHIFSGSIYLFIHYICNIIYVKFNNESICNVRVSRGLSHNNSNCSLFQYIILNEK